jgi:hypothetical protein
MRIGADNRNKTLFAAALLVVAVLLFMRMMAPSTSDASPDAAAKPSANDILRETGDRAPAAPAARRRPQTTNDKTIAAVLKPTLDPRLRLDLLKSSEDVKYQGSGRNIFNEQSEPVIPKTIVSPVITPGPPQPPPGPPPPPPINLKFFGYANKGGDSKSIFLAQGDSVFTARQGDIVAGRYRVVKINPTSVEIQDVLSNNTQTIPLTQG